MLAGLDGLIFVLSVAFLLDILHEAVELGLMPGAKRYFAVRVGRVIEALPLACKHCTVVNAAEPGSLGWQLDTLGVRVNANSVIGGRRKAV